MVEVLERPGCVLHYRDSRTSGVPVLLTHGAGADRRMFGPQYDALAATGYRVIAWDLRGHGASRPNHLPFTADRALEDLLALIDHLDLDRPVLVGHSLGGNLSQEAVRRDPGRFAGLVVIDSTWNTGPLTRTERFLLRCAAPVLRLIPTRSLPRLMANASAVTTHARHDAARAFGQLSKTEFIEVWQATISLVAPVPAYRTPVPLCLIRGAHDTTGNIATAMPRWAAAEGINEHVIADAGHIATQDAPQAVTDALLTFLHTGRAAP